MTMSKIKLRIGIYIPTSRPTLKNVNDGFRLKMNR